MILKDEHKIEIPLPTYYLVDKKVVVQEGEVDQD